jgi:uncharacterized protein (TIGR03435 family)
MMMGPMLQALLEDRFRLKVHRETRDGPVYALTVAKSGLRIQPLKDPCVRRELMAGIAPLEPGQKPPNYCNSTNVQMNGPSITMDMRAMSMTFFAGNISPGLDRPVIDKTGVEGVFDIHLEFAPDQSTPGYMGGGKPATDGAAQSIFPAIQELGLKLEPARGPVEFLVVDRVERPSEN